MPPLDTERDRLVVLLERVQQGSNDAAWQLVNEYGHHVRRAVRRRLPDILRPKFDSLDFVQLTWLSFFRATDRFVCVNEPARFVRLLAEIATHKVLDEVRKRGLGRYNVRKECGDVDPVELEAKCVSRAVDTPSQLLAARESWEKVLQQCSPVERRIMVLRQKGMTYDDISGKLQVSRRTAIRTVRRVLESYVA